MQTFENLDLKGKRVLLRADLNVPVKGNHIEDKTRLARLKPTIELLKAKRAKIILMSHFGRPDGVRSREFSLEFLVPELEAMYQTKVRFCEYINNESVSLSHKVEMGEILLLENLRFHPEEEKNDIEFARLLAQHGDVYINDAFSCSHRAHTSIAAITQLLPAYAGLLMIEEVKNLEMIFKQETKPLMVIIGGKKVSTKFRALEFMDGFCDYLVICGAMANTMLKAAGHDIQASYHEPDLVLQAKEFLDNAKSQIILPSDVVVARGEKFENASTCDVTGVPPGTCILDAGPATCSEVSKALEKCKTVLWNGPFGMFEDERFRAATDSIAHKIAGLTGEGSLKSIAGGGDTVSALERAGVAKDFTYISTAGGAFLEWLEAGTLPGIEALRKNSSFT